MSEASMVITQESFIQCLQALIAFTRFHMNKMKTIFFSTLFSFNWVCFSALMIYFAIFGMVITDNNNYILETFFFNSINNRDSRDSSKIIIECIIYARCGWFLIKIIGFWVRIIDFSAVLCVEFGRRWESHRNNRNSGKNPI